MKKLFLLLALFTIGAASFQAGAQRRKLAIFAPLYLDSAFTYTGEYRFSKTFPKFLNPGAEFYQGVQLALDSLKKRGAPLEVFVFDTKARGSSIPQQMRSAELSNVEMVIAQSNPFETRQLADIALAKKIPFLSATLPNDASVTNNPYFVVLNTTLQGHIEGLYRMLQKSYSLDRIILFRKSGQQEDAIKTHFVEFGRTTSSVPLNIRMVDIGENFTPQMLAAQMDSTRRNVVIAGSMDEDFGVALAKNLSQLSKYPTTLIGMPTWDNFNFNRPEFKSLDIIYSTPFFYNRLTPLESRLASNFEKQIGSRPTDYFFRGYEVTMRFALLLLDAKKDVASSLVQKGNYVFTRFDIQPVFKDKKNMTLDYFENKNINFVRVTGGFKRLM
ncbi:ABC transporter substrate-binding protein [Flavisolibacter nicotianae]|uniref:ABC transporter substrate-binding protein n=1 Tax=Flavisolibacter nicotianae TaxID=2364882 RepID=UPI000EB599AE|nr:ABC transporter substrate-binding protein [Flavisolibacter nicotianae]